MDPDTALAGFGRALRAAGVPVTPDRTAAYVAASAAVGANNPTGLYWAGRATLCSDPDQFARYDAVFADWFGGDLPRRGQGRPRSVPARTSLAPDADGTQGADRPDRERETELVRARASGADVLRHRDVADLSAAEKALLAQLFATLDPRAPRRRALRRSAWHRGELDARRTLREELRRGGEPGQLRYRRRRTRARRVVLVVDVSGSMAQYADALLRLGPRLGAQRPPHDRGVHRRHPAHPRHRAAARSRRRARPARGRSGGAGLVGRHPARARCSRRSSTGGARGAPHAARSSSSSATAGSAAHPACSPSRWRDCTGWRIV
jgi:hypothetical protein